MISQDGGSIGRLSTCVTTHHKIGPEFSIPLPVGDGSVRVLWHMIQKMFELTSGRLLVGHIGLPNHDCGDAKTCRVACRAVCDQRLTRGVRSNVRVGVRKRPYGAYRLLGDLPRRKSGFGVSEYAQRRVKDLEQSFRQGAPLPAVRRKCGADHRDIDVVIANGSGCRGASRMAMRLIMQM